MTGWSLTDCHEKIQVHRNADCVNAQAAETGTAMAAVCRKLGSAKLRSISITRWLVRLTSKGPNKSQALREALLHLLKDRRYRHPFLLGWLCVSDY
jgi:hypothetical protein